MRLAATYISQTELLEWLGGKFEPRSKAKPFNLSGRDGNVSKQIALVWDPAAEDAGIQKGPLIAVRQESIREFLAFVSTYVSTHVPFTAFFRVLSIEYLAENLAHAREPKREPVRDSIVGIAIAEAFMQTQSKARLRSLSSLSVQACLATLSSSVIAGLRQEYEAAQLAKIGEHWLRSRRLLTDEQLIVPAPALMSFWDLATRALEPARRSLEDQDLPSRLVISFVRDFFDHDGREPPPMWSSLMSQLPDVAAEIFQMQGSREDRVRALDRLVAPLIGAGHVDRRIREVAAGYLLSQVADASLEYVPLTAAFESDLPLATMWFGFFCSMSKRSDALLAGDGLGRHVNRLVARNSVFSPPEADISLDELDLYLAHGSKSIRFRTDQQASIAVELLPSVAGLFRNPKAARPDVEAGSSLIDEELKRELRFLLNRAREITDQLDMPNQKDLFPRTRGRPPRRQ